MKEKIIMFLKHAGLTLLAITFIFTIICSCMYLNNTYIHKTNYQVYKELTTLKYESTKLNLANVVDNYIHTVAPLSCLNGISVVDKCIEYEIDICFVLAQGEIESHFGTQGLARKTNSVWNVFAFDGHKFEEISNKGKYQSPDKSIEPYLILLKNKYFINGKTEYDLMHKYVDKNGKRYASTENYENQLLTKYMFIKNNTAIDSLTMELGRYAIILGY